MIQKHFYFNGSNFIPSIGWWFPSCNFRAIMSTISSQLLVTSSSLTEDFYKLIRGEEAAKHKKSFISRSIICSYYSNYIYYNRMDSE